MKPNTDKDIRYFIDVDVKSMRVLGWGAGDRHVLAREQAPDAHHRRLFLTKGQFHKLSEDESAKQA